MIASALLQMMDTDVDPATWQPPVLIPREQLRGLPRHGLGRGFKVGKEEIAGLTVALEVFLKKDHAAERRRWLDECRDMVAAVTGLPGVRAVEIDESNETPPKAVITLRGGPGTGVKIVRRLREEPPHIYVGEKQVHQNIITVNPFGLQPGEAAVVAARLRQVLSRA